MLEHLKPTAKETDSTVCTLALYSPIALAGELERNVSAACTLALLPGLDGLAEAVELLDVRGGDGLARGEHRLGVNIVGFGLGR